MKILVTGYKGYIGSHLWEKLKTNPQYQLVGIDLKDGEDILHCLPEGNFDIVFHFAAIPRVEYSVEHPSYTILQNVTVSSKLLEWSKSHGVKRFIFSSSSAIHGNGDGNPTSPYGLQKRMTEMECKLYSDLYGLDTVCLRYYNAYSEDQEYGGSYSTAICAWMHKLANNEPLRLDGDGTQSRDLIHVDDIVDANIFCMNYGSRFNGECFEVGYGESIIFNDIKAIIDNNYPKAQWIYAPTRAGDVKHTLADISKLKKLGWSPKVSIIEGLERCFKT